MTYGQIEKRLYNQREAYAHVCKCNCDVDSEVEKTQKTIRREPLRKIALVKKAERMHKKAVKNAGQFDHVEDVKAFIKVLQRKKTVRKANFERFA